MRSASSRELAKLASSSADGGVPPQSTSVRGSSGPRIGSGLVVTVFVMNTAAPAIKGKKRGKIGRKGGREEDPSKQEEKATFFFVS